MREWLEGELEDIIAIQDTERDKDKEIIQLLLKFKGKVYDNEFMDFVIREDFILFDEFSI